MLVAGLLGGCVAARGDADAQAVADAVFLTAVDAELESTANAGLADERPGDLLALAAAVCERLDEGAALDDVLAVVLDALTEGGATATDDAHLGGVIVGAGIETGCPQHAALLD